VIRVIRVIRAVTQVSGGEKSRLDAGKKMQHWFRYLLPVLYITYTIDFQYWQWISERNQIDYCREAFSSPETTAIFPHHLRRQRWLVYPIVTCCYTN